MANEDLAGDSTPDREREKGWERRRGQDRRKVDRRSIEVEVEKDRRSGWDRRNQDRRKS